MLEKFLKWSAGAYKKPAVVITIAVVLTLVCAAGIPFLKFDNNVRNMLPANGKDLTVHDYYEDENRFGVSAMIFVGIANNDAYSIESLNYTKMLKDQFEALNNVVPAKMTARLLGLSPEEGVKVVESLRSLGANEFNYTQTLLPLLRDSCALQNQFGWDQAFADKVSKAAKGAEDKKIYDYFENPIDKTQSLVNADYIANEDDTLVVKKLMDDEEVTPESVELLKSRVAGWDVYKEALVSNDGKLSSILIQLNSHDIDVLSQLNKEVASILNANSKDGYTTYVDGEPVIEDMIASYMTQDIMILLPLVAFVVLLILWLCFRHIQGVIYPAAVILMAVVTSVGLMSFCGIPVTVVGTAMPVLLVAIASAYGIHQMSHYFQDTSLDKGEILKHNMGHVGLAITLSGITVMVGFGALVTSDFVPVKNFGIFTALGDLVGIAAALWVLPALILTSKKPKNIVEKERTRGFISSMLKAFVRLNRDKSGLVLVVSVIITLVFLGGSFFIKSELNNVSLFKKSDPVHVADDILNEQLAGTQVLNIVFDSDLSEVTQRKDAPNAEPATASAGSSASDEFSSDAEMPVDIASPAVMNKIEQFSKDVMVQYPEVHKVGSINTIMKKMNQEMNGGDPAFYTIPQDPNLISQYFLMISSDNVKDVLSPNHDKLRISLNMKRTGTEETQKLTEYCLAYFGKDFLKANHIQVQVTGAAHLYYVANDLLIQGTYRSVIICIIIVFLLLLYVLRSFSMSLVAMVPIFMTLAINFGILGLFGIPLNAGTAMVSSVAIGIGVDYSIHYITWYRNELRKKADINHALENTIMHKGRAILYNMFVIVGGFMVMVVSKFIPLIQFGCLVSVCMITTALGALVVVPAIMRLMAKKDRKFLYLGVKKTAS